MKLNTLPLVGGVRDAEANVIITYLKQSNTELTPGLGASNGKNIENTIKSLKDELAKNLDSHINAATLAKVSEKLAASVFQTALYRDTKYSAANRKFLFGLGYHNALVQSARTMFSKKQLELNAK